MGRYLGATPAPALAVAVFLAGCHPAAAPANSAPPPAPAAPATNTAPAPTPVADTADAADAKAFLEGLYAHYKTNTDNSFNMYGASKRQVFDPDVIALLAADQKALKGDVGVLDSDWLCGCQDFVSLQTTIAVQSATPTTAEATADFRDTGMSDDKPGHESFDLVKVGSAWRIHDIHTDDTPSLRKALSDEIKSLQAGGGAASNAN
jgi:hypothetical protein